MNLLLIELYAIIGELEVTRRKLTQELQAREQVDAPPVPVGPRAVVPPPPAESAS